MARWNIHNVRVAGVSACVPKEIVHTEDFPFFDAEGAEVFNNTVGIRERHLGQSHVHYNMNMVNIEDNMVHYLK